MKVSWKGAVRDRLAERYPTYAGLPEPGALSPGALPLHLAEHRIVLRAGFAGVPTLIIEGGKCHIQVDELVLRHLAPQLGVALPSSEWEVEDGDMLDELRRQRAV